MKVCAFLWRRWNITLRWFWCLGVFFLSSVKKTWDVRELFIYTTTYNRTPESVSAVARGFWVGTLVLRNVLVRMEFFSLIVVMHFSYFCRLKHFQARAAAIFGCNPEIRSRPTQAANPELQCLTIWGWDSTINYLTVCSCKVASKSNMKNSTW